MSLILPSQRLIRPNPLAYPAGATPGVDPSHPASAGLRGSVVPVWGALARNLGGTGQFGIGASGGANGTSGVADQYLGPSFTTAFNSYVQFAAPILPTTAVGTGYTFASIVKPLNASVSEMFISNSQPDGVGEGMWQGVFSPGNFALRVTGTVAFDSGVAASNGVPYFYAVSIVYKGSSTWDHNHVILRLDTGQLTAVSVTGTTGSAALNYTQSQFRFGGSTNFGGALSLGAAMTGTTFLNLEQLVAWAQDPWSFWYPNKTINLINGAGVTPPTTQYAAFSTIQRDGGVYTIMTGI